MRMDLSREVVTEKHSSEPLGLVSINGDQKDLLERTNCRVQPKKLKNLNYKQYETFQSFYKALIKLRNKNEKPFYSGSKLNENPIEENKVNTNGNGTSDLCLRERLVKFDKEVIRIACPNTDSEHRLLKPEILEMLLEHEPTNMVEFGKKIPAYLRKPMQILHPQHPDCQYKFIKDVVKIISEFCE